MNLLLLQLLSLLAFLTVSPSLLADEPDVSQYTTRTVVSATIAGPDLSLIRNYPFNHILTLDDGSEWLTMLDMPEQEIQKNLVGQTVYVTYMDWKLASRPLREGWEYRWHIGWVGYELITYTIEIPATPLSLPLSVKDVQLLTSEKVDKGAITTSMVTLSDGSQWVVSEEVSLEALKSPPPTMVGESAKIVDYGNTSEGYRNAMIVARPGRDAATSPQRILMIDPPY